MGRMLKTVIVRHPDTMQPVGLVAGTEVPEWASGLVHPDDIGEGQAAPEPGDESDEASKPRARRTHAK